ncbi:hypothetical protein OM076_31585 [Solirubrobacter ginsenosidimutans]|uniref:Cell division protein FtsL n=1 Tax=Solirubrobacter ginsenosidimutans TaxID=490573 RepID=A0A9X3MY03_9ACTN|nr:hypothetical protein [Solirubrobacter ginsenosidimutans]MDA0164854.1 hypothetical protein [Solirubrobacter ginsenosidimutans]
MPEHARVASRTAPIHPRRVSGPSRRLAPAVAIPRGRTSAFEKLSRVPDHRVVDRLLRGRACIWLIGILLGGIVAMQVSLLRLNSGISRAVQTQGTLEQQNMALQTSIAQLTSSDRVTNGAAQGQMIDPPAGQTRYLTARPDTDPARAARRYKPPSALAKAVEANHGMIPGVLAAPGSAAAALAASLTGGATGATPTTGATGATGTTTPQATATPPAATQSTVPPVATPVATPIATPTPVVTAVPTAPPVTTVPGTGGATAPQG